MTSMALVPQKGSRIGSKKNPTDEWSANPYRVTDPRHSEHEGMVRKAQREQIMDRIGKERAKEMRTSDFTKDALCYHGVSKTGESIPVSHHPYPSRLKEPTSHVERAVEAPELTCHMILQGGALSWACQRNGDIVVRNGFTAAHIATFNVSDEIPMDDPALETYERTLRMSDRRSDKMKRQGGNSYHKNENEEQLYACACQLLGESNYAAVLLNNDTIRVYDTITLVPVTQLSIAPKDDDKSAREDKSARGESPQQQPEQSDCNKGREPFGAILPLDTQSNPITFCVMHADTAHVIALQFPDLDVNSVRPVMEVIRFKSYRKLGLRFVSAGTDDFKTIIYVGDEGGKIWWIDLQDMLVIDSLTIVPPPAPASPKKGKRGTSPQRRSPERGTSPSKTRSSSGKTRSPARRNTATQQQGEPRKEVTSAVSAFKDFIVAGSSTGRVVAFLKQPFGEKPMLVIDEEAAHAGGVIAVAPDERFRGFWCISEDGMATCWSLMSYEQVFSTTVPVESLITACAVLPHTVASKVWTITTSGINNVYMTESNSSHEEMKLKIDQMVEVLASQENAYNEKQAEIRDAQHTLNSRLRKIVTTLETAALNKTLRTYYYTWLNYKIRAIAKRNRNAAAKCMGSLYDRDLMRIYYLRMVGNMNANRASKQRVAMVTHLNNRNDDIMLRRFYNKLYLYVFERKSVMRNHTICNSVLKTTSALTQAQYLMCRWRRFVGEKSFIKYNQRCSSYLCNVEANRLRSMYYSTWVRFHHKLDIDRRNQAMTKTMCCSSDYALIKRYYYMWHTLYRSKQNDQTREKWMTTKSSMHDYLMLRHTYDTLAAYREARKVQKTATELAETKDKHAQVKREYVAVEPKGTRKKRIAELQEKLAEAKLERDAVFADMTAVNTHNMDMKKRIADKRRGGEASATSTRAELISTAGRLRSKCINLETDCQLVQRVMIKSKNDPVKGFNVAFTELRKLVNEYFGPMKHDGTWALGETDLEIRKAAVQIKPEAQVAIVNAVKNMCVAFDAITPQLMTNNLGEQGRQLMINGDALGVMYEDLSAIVHKRKAAAPPEKK